MRILLTLLLTGFIRNPNPLRLNSKGETAALYLQSHRAYTLILYAPGIGHYCNGTPVGQEIWRRDDVRDDGDLYAHTMQPYGAITQFFDKAGKPVAYGFLCSYITGTTRPQFTLRGR